MYFGTGRIQWWCDKIHRIKIFDQNDHVLNGSKNFLIEINVFFCKEIKKTKIIIIIISLIYFGLHIFVT